MIVIGVLTWSTLKRVTKGATPVVGWLDSTGWGCYFYLQTTCKIGNWKTLGATDTWVVNWWRRRLSYWKIRRLCVWLFHYFISYVLLKKTCLQCAAMHNACSTAVWRACLQQPCSNRGMAMCASLWVRMLPSLPSGFLRKGFSFSKAKLFWSSSVLT